MVRRSGEVRLVRRFGGVRLRTTAAATLAVAVFLAAAADVFVVVQRHQLEATITEAAVQQAEDISALVARHGAAADLAAGGGEQSLVQLVDASGTVVAASASITGEPAVVAARPAPGTTRTLTSGQLPIGENEDFVVVARGVTGPDGPVVVLVAQSLEVVSQSTDVVIGLLLVGYPLVVAAVAVTAYWLVGRALSPVEAIRSQVAQIQGADTLTARVPVPAGHDEIHHLAVTMNAMLERLDAATQTQRRFIADASHELRSPLATIRAAHEIAAVYPQSTDWDETGRDVLAELDRLDRLVADLLLLARTDEHGLPLHVVDVDLDDLVRHEADRLRKLGSVRVTVEAAPVRVQADPARLARVLRNLTDNAARHARSRVTLRVHADGHQARVEVEDDGVGVAEADRERIFDRFVRLDDSRARATGGAGLGLAIAREIATAHGGELRVEQGGTGARFVLTLPLDPADQPTTPAAQS